MINKNFFVFEKIFIYCCFELFLLFFSEYSSVARILRRFSLGTYVAVRGDCSRRAPVGAAHITDPEGKNSSALSFALKNSSIICLARGAHLLPLPACSKAMERAASGLS